MCLEFGAVRSVLCMFYVFMVLLQVLALLLLCTLAELYHIPNTRK